jgi:hypothetical protein
MDKNVGKKVLERELNTPTTTYRKKLIIREGGLTNMYIFGKGIIIDHFAILNHQTCKPTKGGRNKEERYMTMIMYC